MKTVHTNRYQFEGRIPLRSAIPLGIQHVLAMFIGNLTPIIILCSACGITASDPSLYVTLLQNAMLVSGLVTLVQLYSIGPVGGQVPIIMGTSAGFIGISQAIAAQAGGGILAYATVLGASIVGGLFEALLSFIIKPLRRIFPPVVAGTVVLTIGLSLIPVGAASFAGGSGAEDFGSLENLLIAFAVLAVIIGVQYFTRGMVSSSSVIIAIVFGYVLCAVLALILPTTGVTAEGATYTKAWVIDWDKISDAPWFKAPVLLPVKPVFRMSAIIPMLLLFIISTIETVGDTAACIEGGMGREPTDREISGAIACDGLGSSFAALFGALPNTSFSQNVGLVALTKVVNRFALSTGALFLVLCGLCPKLAALLSVMPQSVLGGAAVLMFSSIMLAGIQMISRDGITPRVITIVSAALGLGYGLSAAPGATDGLGPVVSLMFSGSGIFPAAFFAVLLNLILPQDQKR